MSLRWLLFFHALLLCLPYSSPAGNGKITGRVTASDSSGLPAIIALRGSGRSVLSDSAGHYQLLNVAPGTYDVKASAIGYQPVTIGSVRVIADETVTLFFELAAGDITLPEILIVEKRPPIEKTRTSAKTTFDGEEVNGLPLAGVSELISTAPGVYGPFIRGAHQYDARVYVDGVDITDRSANWVAERGAFSNDTYNQSTRTFSNSAFLQSTMHTAAAATQTFLSPSTFGVAQATVYTGMTGADYGTAPGIITYALKEGRGLWHGMLQFRMSQPGGLRHIGPSVYSDAAAYFSARDNLLQSANPQDRTKAGYYTWSPGKYPYGEKPAYTCEFGLGGSVADWMGLYISGGWFDSHGRLPNEWTRKANATTKLTIPVSTALRLNVLGMLEDRGQLLGWKNRAFDDWYKFFLEGVPLWDGKTVVGSIKLTHFFSPSACYELQVSYSDNSTRRGFSDDNNDGIVSPWESGNFLTCEDSTQVNRYFSRGNVDHFFGTLLDVHDVVHVTGMGLRYRLGYPLFLYENYTHRTLHVRGLLTSQMTPEHQLSVGGEVRRHRIDKVHRSSQSAPYNLPYFEEEWSRSPAEFSGFVQDRMEYDGLTATIGIRVDAFDFHAADIADYFAPARDATNAEGGTIKVPVRGENIPVKTFVSPRVGISHPITDRALLYYSFTRTVSPPPYSSLYYNYNSWLLDAQTILRIDHEPQVTTTYDLGVQWLLLEGLTGSLGLFYRDMNNYSLSSIQAVIPRPYGVVRARVGSADTRGAELSIEYRSEQEGALTGTHARLAYTYSTFNLGRTLYLNQWQYTADQCSTLGIPGQLPFDDMQYWYRTYGRDYSGKSPMLSGFDRTHRITFLLSMPLPYAFRIGCTGTFASGFYYPEIYGNDDAPGTTYSAGYREAPWNKRIDLRLEKQITLPGLGVAGIFVDVINVFNWTNILSYFSFNEATFKAWANNGDPTGGPGVNQPVTMEGSLIYGIPREVYFGVNVTF